MSKESDFGIMVKKEQKQALNFCHYWNLYLTFKYFDIA